jgi:hypothetical protein
MGLFLHNDICRNTNVLHQAAHASGRRTHHPATPDHLYTSQHYNSTNISAINKAIKDLESRDQVDKHMYKKVTLKYSYSRSAVLQR